MQYFYYSVGVIALLYTLGLGFTILLLPESLRRYTLILAPWVGYCYASLACWPVFYYGGRISTHTAQLVLIAPTLCLVIELVRKRRSKLGRTILHVPTVGALLLAGAAFVVLSTPILCNPVGGLTTVSLGNNDIAGYGAIGRYLAEFNRHSREGFVGQMAFSPLPLEWAAKDFYFGPPAFAAFAGRWLGLMPHQDLSLCVFLLSALGATALFIVLSDTLCLSTSGALVGVAFVAFHPMLQFIALEGFFPQVAGTGLAVLIFWTNAKLLEKNHVRLDRTRLWLLLVLFTCGLVLNYPHMLLFIWFFVALYAVILALLEKSLHAVKVCAAANVLGVGATALILPQRIGPFIEVFTLYASVEAGWFVPWMAPDYVAGLMYQNPFLQGIGDSYVHLGVSILVGLVFILAMCIAYRNGYRRVVAVGIACVIVYAGSLFLAVKGQNNGILGGYNSFKLVSYYLPFFGLTLVALMEIARASYKRLGLAIPFIAVAIAISYARADNTMLRQTRYLKVGPGYKALLALERNKDIKSVNVLGNDWWRTMWTAYFLMHKELHLEHQSYYATSELVGEYDLEDKVSSRFQIIHVKPAVMPSVKRLNERFTLIGPLKRKVRAKLGEGWHLGEVGHVWTGKEGRRASIILRSEEEGVIVRLSLICAPLRQDDRLTLRFHGEPLHSTVNVKSDGREEILSELTLSKGDNEVEIVADQESVPANTADPRRLSYCFSSIDVEEL